MMAIQFNPIVMNEYRGFKVGDRVEITGHGAPIIGKITSFGDHKSGGCIEPDSLEVWINKTVSFDLLSLMRRELIKKLFKYAVDDVVRYNGKIATIDELSDTPPFFLVDIYGEGRVWALTSELEHFDGFRIFDTVWTAKRGKGKIIGESTAFEGRPFWVRFEKDTCDRIPKLSNLFPTERKMVESPTKGGFGISVLRGFATPEPFGIFATRHFVIENTPLYGQATADHMRPKFKVGDAVYSGGTKWIIDDVQQHSGYRIRSTERPHLYVIAYEYELRLWKETKYKGSVAGHEGMNPQYVITSKIPHLSNVKCIGQSAMGDDIFIADLNTGKQVVLFGTKGDDI